MKHWICTVVFLVAGFGESRAELPTVECQQNCGALLSLTYTQEISHSPLLGGSSNIDAAGPGLNKKARRISRKSRRHTIGKTRGSAAKTRGAVKKRGRGYQKASRKGFNRANKRAAPKKKAGCN